MDSRLLAGTTRIASSLRTSIQKAELTDYTLQALHSHRRRFTTTRKYRTLDSIPHFSHSVNLPNRVIAISGPDASTFLQGLITSNVSTAALEQPNAQPGPDYTAKYAGLLNAQGRILNTFMVYPIQHDSSIANLLPQAKEGELCFLIDIPSAEAAQFQQRLKLYKLKSKVKIDVMDKIASIAAWNDSQSDHRSTSQALGSALLAAKDERAPSFGTRILAQLENVDQLLKDTRIEPLEYILRRYEWGIPEGTTELVPATALPHESNLDYMGAIDFRKGCYVGQELTIRTQHQGVIRKRIMPLKIEGAGEQKLEGLDLKVKEGGKRSVGKILANTGNVGIGLIRLAQAGFASEVADGEAQCDDAAGEGGVDLKVEGIDGVLVKPVLPTWWKEKKGKH